MPVPPSPTVVRRFALGAALLHLAVVGHHVYRGVSIRHDFPPSTWDWFWQNLRVADLRERALESLWQLHAQPPLWNALNAPLIKLFGESQPEALFGLHVAMGMALSALAAWVVASIIGQNLARKERNNSQTWFALACSWALGMLVYAVIFAIGEALLEASFRARLPIWFWVVYYAYVGAYSLNVGLGLFVHILISSIFALGAGRFAYEKFVPNLAKP